MMHNSQTLRRHTRRTSRRPRAAFCTAGMDVVGMSTIAGVLAPLEAAVFVVVLRFLANMVMTGSAGSATRSPKRCVCVVPVRRCRLMACVLADSGEGCAAEASRHDTARGNAARRTGEGGTDVHARRACCREGEPGRKGVARHIAVVNTWVPLGFCV